MVTFLYVYDTLSLGAYKTPSSEPIFLLPKTSSHHFPRHSTLISPAAAEELTMKPRCGEFHRQFSPIPGKRPELEVRAGSRVYARRRFSPGDACTCGRA